jgi:hypothetical protein
MNPPPARPLTRPGHSTFKRKILPRLVFVLPFVVSTGLLWWSLDKIQPVIRESEELTTRTTKLTQQIEEMEMRQKTLSKENVLERYSAVMDRHFAGQDAVVSWLEELRDKAITLALDFNPRFGDAENKSVATESLTLIPVTIEVKPAIGIQASRNAYHRLLEFNHFMANHPKRADLLKLTITGRNGAAAKAVFNLNLWGVAPKT